MKRFLEMFAFLGCLTAVYAGDTGDGHVTPPPWPDHGKLLCLFFAGSDYICKVKCDPGHVPERPIPHSYDYRDGKWTTVPLLDSNGEPFVFPWPNCVPASK
ncbi:uncharacterized protein [Pocillopora verrucosa]|uniref:uncharacterized protein n=1 Tax=Pocillopora verrucosa TaxID=203993 RepID=UPI002797966B|nr:uncharacterized protein LOC131783282 [Pocillopora verrucosa]